jgi:sugar lactone lactonase YvrE
VQAVIWEVQPGGVRDSVVGPGGWFISIPVRPEWAGQKIQIRLFARDASGLVSDTIVAPADSLFIYPSVDRPTTWTTLSGYAEDVIIDQARGALYLMQGAGIRVFSLGAREITETIPLPSVASDADLTAGGDSLVLTLPYNRALGIIDLRQPSRTVTLVPLRSVDSTLGQAPYQVRIAANGRAYVGLAGPSAAANRLLEVDLGTGAERLLPDAGRDGLTGGAGLERSFDRTVLVLSQRLENLLQRYDVAADAFGPIQTRVNVQGPLRIDRTGARVSVGLDIYDADLAFQRRVTAPYGALYVPGAALSPDGEYLYQAIALRGVARTRVSDGVLVDRSPTPFSATGYLRVSPDGTMLVIMDSFNGTLKIATMDLR